MLHAGLWSVGIELLLIVYDFESARLWLSCSSGSYVRKKLLWR